MNTKNMKRWVLAIGIIGVLFLAIAFSLGMSCYRAGSCPNVPSFVFGVIDNKVVNNDIFQLIFLTPLLLLLSLLTYWAKNEVFHAWFNFAKWFVPIIIATTLYFELKGGGGGGWGIGSGLDQFVILWLLYGIFIITSLVKIVRAYLKTKSGN